MAGESALRRVVGQQVSNAVECYSETPFSGLFLTLSTECRCR